MSIDTNQHDLPTPKTVADGTTVYVDRDEREEGDLGPFYVAYTDRSQSEQFGYVCGACQSESVTMGPMGRIACAECGNRRGATEWDAAYL